MRSSIKCMIQANVKWLQTLRINWAAWQRKRKLAGVPVSASIPCWQPLSRRAVWTVVFAVLLLAMVVFVVPVCLLTQLSRGNFRSWPSVTFYLINLRLCLPLYRPTKNLSLNIRLHVHDDCLYGFFSGKARPWLICFNWLAQTWLVCFQSTSTQHKRYSIVWALTHTHTHTRQESSWLRHQAHFICSWSAAAWRLSKAVLSLPSNSLNPEITLQPSVFVYHGLNLHIFITAAVTEGKWSSDLHEDFTRAGCCPNPNAVKPLVEPVDKSYRYGLYFWLV